MSHTHDHIYLGDCVEQMYDLERESVDLVLADPPFNIGYRYDIYKDKIPTEKYTYWCSKWMESIYRLLKPSGSFWLAIGDEFAADLKVIADRSLGFTCRSWVIWHYTFGVNCVNNFTRSHTHLFYFVKDADSFTFNADAIRVPSARQLVYNDKRANAAGRLPDNTWILRPQDAPDAFDPLSDSWHVPRVCGTFKERKGWHGCQMPEMVLGRIIRACSNPGELVLDCFAGSGTTLAVAKKLDRRYLGFELSPEYHARATDRLESIQVGDSLDGTEKPFATSNQRKAN